MAFVRDQQLWRVALDSGEVLPIGAAPRDLSGSGGGVWTRQNEIVLSGSDVVGLVAVPLNGGPGRELLPLDQSEESDFHEVSSLPDGRACSSRPTGSPDPTRSLPWSTAPDAP